MGVQFIAPNSLLSENFNCARQSLNSFIYSLTDEEWEREELQLPRKMIIVERL